jgi:cytoskeletal protein CcmA (bactofilin family)
VTTQTTRAVIGGDLVVQGAIRNAQEVEVWGSVLGAIAAERVVIHPGGRVVGTLEVGAADVHGLLDGRVRVRNLINIGKTGVVHGDVRYGQLALAAGGDLAAEVRNVPPELAGDFEMTVKRGGYVRITSADLSANDVEDGAHLLTYTLSNAASGFVALVSAPAAAVETFTQADIAAGSVIFVHDGTGDDRAGFDVVLRDSQGESAGPPRHVSVAVLTA